MDTDLIGFIDESKKPVRDPATGKVAGTGEHYVVAAAVVFRANLDEARSALNHIVENLGFSLHYKEFRGRERKLAAIAAIQELDGWDAYIFETASGVPARAHSEHRLRSKIIGAAYQELFGGEGVNEVVAETRAHVSRGLDQLDTKDHEVLRRLQRQELVDDQARLRHSDKSEPMLQLADIVAGARTDHLCGLDREPFGMLAHRVRRIVAVDV